MCICLFCAGPFNNIHMNGPTEPSVNSSARMSRGQSGNFVQQQQMPVENGIDFRHTQSNQGPNSNNSSTATIR